MIFDFSLMRSRGISLKINNTWNKLITTSIKIDVESLKMNFFSEVLITGVQTFFINGNNLTITWSNVFQLELYFFNVMRKKFVVFVQKYEKI